MIQLIFTSICIMLLRYDMISLLAFVVFFSTHTIYFCIFSIFCILSCWHWAFIWLLWRQGSILPVDPLLTFSKLNPPWVRDHMPGQVCNEISYPFPNFNGCTVFGMNQLSHPTLNNGCNYLSVLRLKLINVNKRCQGRVLTTKYNVWHAHLLRCTVLW